MPKALVVDDDRMALTVMVRTIEASGYECLCARSAAEALEIIKQNEIAVMVTDLKMPDMDGFELFQKVRKDHEHIRGILCSANVSYTSIHEINQAGFDDCIAKPIDGPNLVQALRRSMDKHTRWVRRSHSSLRALP